ncbi:MAG: hypothetical protein QM571_00035 [Micrococcaceae bacterium]
MSRKYEITDIGHPNFPMLHRIRAVEDFESQRLSVKKGDLGGYVQSERNLSHDGSCWVKDKAVVMENSIVKDSAVLEDEVYVWGNAKVTGNTHATGGAHIIGSPVVCDSLIKDAVFVTGNARVTGATVEGVAVVTDNARVDGSYTPWMPPKRGDNGIIDALPEGRSISIIDANVSGNALVKDNVTLNGFVKVRDNAKVSGNAEVIDQVIIKDHAKVKGSTLVAEQAIIAGKSKVTGNAHVRGNVVMVQNSEVGEDAFISGVVTLAQSVKVAGNTKLHHPAVLIDGKLLRFQELLRSSGKYSDDIHPSFERDPVKTGENTRAGVEISYKNPLVGSSQAPGKYYNSYLNSEGKVIEETRLDLPDQDTFWNVRKQYLNLAVAPNAQQAPKAPVKINRNHQIQLNKYQQVEQKVLALKR